MEKALTKDLRVVVIRTGIQISIEKDKADKVDEVLESITTHHKFMKIEGRSVNTADLVGVFEPIDLEELSRRKRGEWQDENGNWIGKGEYKCSTCGNIVPIGKRCGFCG